jgi:hypothetical protein
MMACIQGLQILIIVTAIYNIYVSSMSLKWIKNIEEKGVFSNARVQGLFKERAPKFFIASISVSVIYIIASILVGDVSAIMDTHTPKTYLMLVIVQLLFLMPVKAAQFALLLENCHKQRIIIPLINFRFSIPIYQNQNKSYF